MSLATTGLSGHHPGRLGLALNFSVFQNEVLKDRQSAIALAKQTLSTLEGDPIDPNDPDASANMDIMQILAENLLLWQQSSGGEDGTAVEEM